MSKISSTIALPTGLRAGRSGEDHVGQRIAAQAARRAFAHDPADRVDDVRLAAAVRADDAGHVGRQVQHGRIDEGLEAGQLDRGQSHGNESLGCAARAGIDREDGNGAAASAAVDAAGSRGKSPAGRGFSGVAALRASRSRSRCRHAAIIVDALGPVSSAASSRRRRQAWPSQAASALAAARRARSSRRRAASSRVPRRCA